MTYNFKALGVAAALALSPMAASAATVTFTNVTGQNYQTVYDSFLTSAPRIVENFAGDATPGGTNVPVNAAAQNRTNGNTITTSVGTFAGLGGTGEGLSVTGNGDQIQVRSGNNFGRFNVLESEGNFLDSNDTLGFDWSLTNTGGKVRGVSAFITDPSDAGRQLTLRLLDEFENVTFTDTVATGQDNATVWHLTADFTGVTWSTAVFEFEKNGLGDGFAISNATIHAVPLPAAGWLMIAGLGGLAALRRRKRAA